jgi:hypothetical protein
MFHGIGHRDLRRDRWPTGGVRVSLPGMRSSLVVAIAVLAGCGSSSSQPQAPQSPAPSALEPTDGAAPVSAPPAQDEPVSAWTSCANASSAPCLLPRPVLKRLCSRVNPDAAIALFAKDSPWTRAYVNVRQADSYNGLGGPSSQQKLFFDEELLILGERNADLGGMSVSGAGTTYDLMRWDGSCAALSAAEVTQRRPPQAKHATVPWRILSDEIQAALTKDERTDKLMADRRKQCKGVTSGEVTKACEKTDRALNDRIVEAVRGGLTVPVPKLP